MYLNKKSYKFILLFLTMLVCLWGCGRIPDGEYAASVTLTGGSGKAYIESPCVVTINNGKAVADITWSSPNYDFMVVDDKTYTPINTEGNSEFVIPIRIGEEMAVQADTTAMSTPHLIDYTLLFEIEDKEISVVAGNNHENGKESVSEKQEKHALEPPVIDGFKYISTDNNDYAECYRIHRYDHGAKVISVDDGRNYLLLPENENVPTDISSDISVIKEPLSNIYLAASGAMCHFDSIGATDLITLSGTERDDWYIDSAKEAMDQGEMVYGGKYSAPDYEMMLNKDIHLAIENMMILHVPKVQEKLESLGIPVFIDRSSYENEPLGRLEWIKIYGLMTGREDAAYSYFDEQKDLVTKLDKSSISGKKVAVFALNSNHQIATRKDNDYLAKMIELAGGTYLTASDDLGETSSSQLTISTEAFYDYASSADIIIYNTAIEDAPASLEKLMEMDVTFKNFSAMQERKVWCTDKSLYQYANEAGKIIYDLHEIVSNEVDSTDFFYKLK